MGPLPGIKLDTHLLNDFDGFFPETIQWHIV